LQTEELAKIKPSTAELEHHRRQAYFNWQKENAKASAIAAKAMEKHNNKESAKASASAAKQWEAAAKAVRQAAETKERDEATKFDETNKLGRLEDLANTSGVLIVGEEEQIKQTNELEDEEDQAEAGATKLEKEEEY
jgi:hypothetical protein